MTFTRREIMVMTAGASVALTLPMTAAYADEALVTEAIAAFTGGADVVAGDAVTLTTPEIAENGNTVPVEASAPGATALLILATKNPTPRVIEAAFGAKSGTQSVSTRMRLAGTQNVLAIAKLADGTFVSASNEVKVTIGGCGG